MVAVPKKQLGLRIDRVLYAEFLDVCKREKLGPSEAVEALVQAAVEKQGITSTVLSICKNDDGQGRVDGLRFRSMLNRMEKHLEMKEKMFGSKDSEYTGEHAADLMIELYELAPKIRDETLLDRFEKIVEKSDKLRMRQLEAEASEALEEASEF